MNIDATGLLCPKPLMLLKQGISEIEPGDSVEIRVSDVHAELDFEIWCEHFGHQLSYISTTNQTMLFKVTKFVLG
ncbi:MAG: sulfurtransferase TusA family protein [Proteobacteria bacterium]|nr:sulfurtransferase TusA family protein [Pseudomonadota bacterium]